MTDHAILSASGAPAWMRCYGKLALEKGLPESSSKYADEGTAAHEVASMCLEQGQDAVAFVGRMLQVKGRDSWEVTEEMAEAVQVYVDLCRSFEADEGESVVEQKCDYTTWILDKEQIDQGIEAYGTTDFGRILPLKKELIGIDYKHGRGVAVSAEENEQQLLYQCGLVDFFSLGYDIEDDWTVRLIIAQPRASNISEWTCTVGDLKEFALRARVAARHAMHQYDGKAPPKLTPGEKQCRFCKAKATCPALAEEVKDIVVGGAAAIAEFSDISEETAVVGEKDDNAWLSTAMSKVDLIEGWCKAVRAETERRLLEGKPVEGFKLVRGRRGARAWQNPDEAELVLKGMRLKAEDMYDRKLIPPTTADKLAKAGTIGKRQWPKVAELIVQPEGGLSVAPVSDKRQAEEAHVSAADFSNVDDIGDLA